MLKFVVTYIIAEQHVDKRTLSTLLHC